MRTNLSMIMKSLTNGILDAYIFNGNDYSGTNQMTFLTSTFPLYFLNAVENTQILKVSKNNSSRISNLFTRQTDPKRRESKFRERFVMAFDAYFVDEMLLTTRYLLRNYNREAFDKWIDSILITDMALRSDENMFFYRKISAFYKKSPHLALTLLLIWAFHIDDFKPIITVLEQHTAFSGAAPSFTTSENDPFTPLKSLLDDFNLCPSDVCDFIEIAYKYGISGYLGAIAIKTYVDSNTHNNPLITAELADMYFYGNNFTTANREKAMMLYTQNANQQYGSGLWSIAQISSNERFDVHQTSVKMSMKYYELAIENNHALSYNNIGKWWLYALHYHLDKIVGIPEYRNIYANQGRQAISDIYQIMMDRTDFKSFLDKNEFNVPINFATLTPDQKEIILDKIELAENFIVENFIMQAYYKQKYYFSLGSCVTLYEYQYWRRLQFSEVYSLPRNKDKESISWQKYVYSVTEYSKFQISNAQLAYAHYLEQINAEAQDIYEYLYKAAFEMPSNQSEYEAILEFLAYHVNPKVVYKKKQINFERCLINALKDYRPNYQSKTYHFYNAVQLMLIYFKSYDLYRDAYESIFEGLHIEALSHPDKIEQYDLISKELKDKFER
ncbi:hypothetical protein [Fusibacter bizertensis]